MISLSVTDFFIKLECQIKIPVASGELIRDRSSSEADISVAALIIAKGTRSEPKHAKIKGLPGVMTSVTAGRRCTWPLTGNLV